MFLLSSFGGKGETKFGKWYRRWLSRRELPVINSVTEKVFCFNCAHYWFDSSRQDNSFRCRDPLFTLYKGCTTDNPINPGGTFELPITKDAWKINKNNDCKYHKEV